MADIEQAIDFILDAEDAAWRVPSGGRITTDAGGRTRYGIAEKYNPAAWANGPPDLAAARHIYGHKYIDSYALRNIRDQDVMNTVADCMVNPGPGAGGKLVQQAVNQCGGICVKVDGQVGLDTLTAINGKPASILLAKLRALRVLHYIRNNTTELWDGLVKRASR